ncbi:MAG TPA: nucleotidyltransferase family protein [Thermoanaerobaculia bacterium]|nr:nucleotidyltransferase family protein [Thermoanaerobaculia bacterium]
MSEPPIPPPLRDALLRTLRNEPAAWPPLTAADVQTLALHGVAPLVYASARCPELRGEAMRAAAIEPLRLIDLRAVLTALAARGVDTLIVKGSALAYDVYEAPELRPRSDTDLLIAREARAAAREVFLGNGYSERLTSGDEHGVRQVAYSRVDSFGVEHVYDVHWDIANAAMFADVLRFEELRARAVPLPAIDPHAFGPSHADALLHACVHRVVHHHGDEKVIWLCDLERLRKRMTDEEHERFWRLAAERRVLSICRRSIEEAEVWFGAFERGRAERWLTRDELQQDEFSRAYLDRRLSYGRETWINLRALTWRDRAQRVWQLAFPPRAFMRQSFPRALPGTLPWLYVYRGVRGVARLFRRAGARA